MFKYFFGKRTSLTELDVDNLHTTLTDVMGYTRPMPDYIYNRYDWAIKTLYQLKKDLR